MLAPATVNIPGGSVDILLLGCGDVRNILFTSHIDDRHMNITCCDNQETVIARNILLLSLVIDSDDSRNNDLLWTIYHHIYPDKKALGLLRSQARKLHELSVTLHTWRRAPNGSIIQTSCILSTFKTATSSIET